MNRTGHLPAAAIALGVLLHPLGDACGAARFCMTDAELDAYSWEVLSVGLDQFFWSCEEEFGTALESHFPQLRRFRTARKAYVSKHASDSGRHRRGLAIRPFERRFPGQGEAAFRQNLRRDAKSYGANRKITLDTCQRQLEKWAKAIEALGFEKSLTRFAAMSVATSQALGRHPLPKCE